MIVSLVDVFYSFSRLMSAFFGQWFGQEFWLTRFVFLRALGFIYFIAFLGIFNQFKGLLGNMDYYQPIFFGSGSGILWSRYEVLLVITNIVLGLYF